MKKNVLILATLTLIFSNSLFAQDSTNVEKKDKPMLYTIGYNRVPEGFNLPLIGVINVAYGNHTGLQLGFANRNSGDFRGLEIGFANAVGGSMNGSQIAVFNAVGRSTNGLTVGLFNAVGNETIGCQIGLFNATGNKSNGVNVGFLNATGNSVNGVQVGFLNTTGNKVHGIQIGFTNILGNKFDGFQAGFVNIQGNEFIGGQVGFVNIIGNKILGTQVGFVNIDGNKVEGVQIGFLNKIHSLSGFQLGFINLLDTVSAGVPVGFFTLVKHGGYQAIELGTSEMYPVNLSFKTGTRSFYTSLIASYGSDMNNPYAFGVGVGTIVPLGTGFSFNPELTSQSTFFNSWNQLYSLHINVLYAFSSHFSLVAGPTLVWNHLNRSVDFQQPVFALYQTELDANNKLVVGLKAAVRYEF